jgi:hypothetical protein
VKRTPSCSCLALVDVHARIPPKSYIPYAKPSTERL